jgi:hypothetical protein
MSTDLRILYLPYNFLVWAIQEKLVPETTMVFWDGYKDVELPPEQVKFILPSEGDMAQQVTHIATLTAFYQGSLFNWPHEKIVEKAAKYVEDFGQSLASDAQAIMNDVAPKVIKFDYENMGAPIYLANLVHPVILGVYYLQKNGMIDSGRVLVYVSDTLDEIPKDEISDSYDWLVAGKSLSEQRNCFLERAEKKVSPKCLELLQSLI